MKLSMLHLKFGVRYVAPLSSGDDINMRHLIQPLPPSPGSLVTMATASSLLLHLHLLPSPPSLFHKRQPSSQLSSISLQTHRLKRRFSISASSSPPPPSDWEREEIRWLREEQRWIREEQRWVREQTRWHSERESLLQEIASLKSQIQELQQQSLMQGSSVTETTEKVASLVQVLKEVDKKQIPESGSGPVPMLLESVKEEVKEMVVEEVKKVRKIEAIRKGAEGEEVLAMQEALLKLGFYSGEEDMEFSSFSSGTERAIKTWQASLGVPEDGIMTAELLKKLYTEQGRADGKSNPTDEKESVNGASVTSITAVSEVKEIGAKESGDDEYGAAYHKVFLLGENRWEDSSRLAGRDKPTDGSTIGISTTKCLACRGEGHVLCTECDGTGDINVEEQFLEWVDEGAKCPYCEGLGYNICDVCEGKTIIHA